MVQSRFSTQAQAPPDVPGRDLLRERMRCIPGITRISSWVSLLLIVGIWVFSICWTSAYASSRGSVVLLPHCLQITIHPDMRQFRADGGSTGFYVRRANEVSYGNTKWLPEFVRPFANIPQIVIVTIPLWIPMTLAVGFTLFLWKARRRQLAGVCSACNYNLEGNVSGTCPECGTLINSSSVGQFREGAECRR
jgi:predicted RNA-binding Zn-ribbon protein involved in translation (DUF1610 family)